MKYHVALQRIVLAIGMLAALAALAGLAYDTPGQPYALTTFRGEEVVIRGHGLYRYDTVSSAAQMQANDAVTLMVALPLLVGSFMLAARGSLRGHLVLTGTLGYLLYTYVSMSFGAAYNALFLVYVALFSLCLFGFVLSLMSFDLDTLPRRFSGRLPRRGIAALLWLTGVFLLLAWLGRIVPTLSGGTTPLLENTTTMFIQALDLGLIVPLSFLAGFWLLRGRPWGYLLASVALTKFVTMGLAVSAMGLNMLRAGVAVSPIELAVFPALTVIDIVMAVLLLRSVDTSPSTTAVASSAPAP